MMQDYRKAYRLEMRKSLESKSGFLLNFLMPILLTILFAEAGSVNCSFCYGYTYFEYYAPLIFVTTVIFISMQLMILRIVGERAPYGTLDRDLLAISKQGMYLGKLLGGMTIAVPQALLMSIVAIGFYQMAVKGSSLLLVFILLLASIIGLSQGLLFSILSRTREQAVQMVPIVIIMLIILSGELILFEDMPTILGSISENLPLSLANVGMKEILINGKSFEGVFMEVAKLLIWIFSINFIAYGRFTTKR